MFLTQYSYRATLKQLVLFLCIYSFRLVPRKNRSYGHQQKITRLRITTSLTIILSMPTLLYTRELTAFDLSLFALSGYLSRNEAFKLCSYNSLIWVRRYEKYLTPQNFLSFYGSLSIWMLQISSFFINLLLFNSYLRFIH